MRRHYLIQGKIFLESKQPNPAGRALQFRTMEIQKQPDDLVVYQRLHFHGAELQYLPCWVPLLTQTDFSFLFLAL